ncbi:MAG: HEAT repeat domain-containing protein, partial [Planctomycetales bacterium]|nr:HEAT repeat domain-containing protein [Planctomycetales bacterium]
IWQAAALSVVLDLANFSVRQGKLPEHPLRSQRAALSRLLGSVVVRLGRLEKSPAEFGDDVAEVQRILNDSVALTISLCDALGWMEDPQAEESLEQALGLSHRRIQVEAAGALARLGSDRGAERLIDLATDPVARLRAVHYAEELDLVHRIDEGQRHPHALAESELAAWLARPEQFGFPPSGMELVESRSLYWPSFEEPQACYLFRYSYALPNGQLSNMGIAGPLTHAFQADLANLPIDDIYAAFAGWQAEHEEIFEVPSAQLNPAQRREADRLQEALTAQGLEIQDTLALTFFLGELALLARVEREGKAACAISDGVELLCYPTSNSPHALTPELVLAIYRGRKLLRTFNADFG